MLNPTQRSLSSYRGVPGVDRGQGGHINQTRQSVAQVIRGLKTKEKNNIKNAIATVPCFRLLPSPADSAKRARPSHLRRQTGVLLHVATFLRKEYKA